MIQDLSIIIPAAGQGERLGLGPKAMLVLADRTLLHWLSAKARSIASEVIVAVPPGCMETWASECQNCRIIEGGTTNLQSVALLARSATLPWVMNLNVSMPFLSLDLIQAVANAAKANDIAGAFLASDLPVAQLKDGVVSKLLSRHESGIAQGPNAYRRELLLSLIEVADAEDWRSQSFLEVAMRHGYPISAVPGQKSHIKITSPEDWIIAQQLTQHLL